MIERPLLSPDELKSMPKGSFVVMKTGAHPMRTRLRLFLDWGISFDRVYEMPSQAAREVAYASCKELENKLSQRSNCYDLTNAPVSGKSSADSQALIPATDARSRRKTSGRPHPHSLSKEHKRAYNTPGMQEVES